MNHWGRDFGRKMSNWGKNFSENLKRNLSNLGNIDEDDKVE